MPVYEKPRLTRGWFFRAVVVAERFVKLCQKRGDCDLSVDCMCVRIRQKDKVVPNIGL